MHVFRYVVVFVAFLESFAHGANDTASPTSGSAREPPRSPRGHPEVRRHVGQLDFGLLRRVHRLLVRHGRVRLDGHPVVGHVRRRRLRGPRRGDAGLPGDPDARQRHRRDRLPHGVLCRVRLDGDRRRGNLPRPPDLVETHCQVGAIVFVGMAKHGLHGSDCALFGKIALTWVATIPLAAAIAALMMLPARAAITL